MIASPEQNAALDDAWAILARLRTGEGEGATHGLPEDRDRREALAVAFAQIGDDAFEDDDLTTARLAFWRLFVLRLALLRAAPDSPRAIEDYAAAAGRLGEVMLELGRLENAEKLLIDALTRRTALRKSGEGGELNTAREGLAQWSLARLARARGESEDELRRLRAAVAAIVSAGADQRATPAIRDALAQIDARIAGIG